MLVSTSLSALAAGETVPLSPGDTLRVHVSFKYTVAQAVTVYLKARLGRGLMVRIDSLPKPISLQAALTPMPWPPPGEEGYLDIPIPSGAENGSYWLEAEVQGYGETRTRIEDAAIISGGAMAIPIAELMAVMMMTMMMGMVGEET